MSKKEILEKEKSIILIGDFNPKIFQPSWFAAHKLIKEQESDNAVIGIIHESISDFKLDWCRFQVTRDRLALISNQENSFELIRDLIHGTFSLLIHTPIKLLGINLDVHVMIQEIDKWHELGFRLTPRDVWLKFFKDPRMRGVQVENKREDGYTGYNLVNIQPSLKYKQGGVFISTNDHYKVEGTTEIIKILDENWQSSNEFSLQIIDSILSEI